MAGLWQRATVYTVDTDGAYTAVARTGLRCRLVLVTIATVQTGEERAELAGRRLLLWEPGVTLPARAEIEIDGVRWAVLAGTEAAVAGPTGGRVYWRAAVVPV